MHPPDMTPSAGKLPSDITPTRPARPFPTRMACRAPCMVQVRQRDSRVASSSVVWSEMGPVLNVDDRMGIIGAVNVMNGSVVERSSNAKCVYMNCKWIRDNRVQLT